MKALKIILSAITPLAAITPVVFTTSCGEKETFDEEDNKAIEYIHDRSFSLLGFGNDGYTKHCGWGTCWIISDATPDTTDDYQYYIATNWHVIFAHEKAKKASTVKFDMYFGDDTKSEGLTAPDDYRSFVSYELENESNFYYSSRTDAIDFYIAKADFANAKDTAMQAKLDKLNALQAENGYITQFAPKTDDVTQYMCEKMYIAGFPVKNEYYATWEKHKVNPTDAGMFYQTYGTEDGKHNIDDNGKYVDYAPQYTYSKNMGSSWMSGGASGSMLLGKFDDGYKVCGIYWGGWTNKARTALYPSFSIFRSDKKDFVEDYIK